MAKTANSPIILSVAKSPATSQSVSFVRTQAYVDVSALKANSQTVTINNADPTGGTPAQNQKPADDKTFSLEEIGKMPAADQLMKFEELAKLRDLTDEEKEAKNAAESNVAATKEKVNAGKIDKSFNDPDWGKPEKSKFDIQQGDIIEFLMKEVVLAAAAECGDKLFSAAGTGLYRGGSIVWHFGVDKYEESKAARAKFKEDWKKHQDKEKKEREEANELAKGKPEDPNNLQPESSDSQTLAFSKIIRGYRQETLKSNAVSLNHEALTSMIDKALSKDWDPRKLNNDEIAVLNMQTSSSNSKEGTLQYLNMLHQIAENTNYDPTKMENIKTTFTDIMEDHFIQLESQNIFSANYAAAYMIHEKTKDPKFKFTDPNTYEAQYKLYLEQGKKTFLLNQEKIYDQDSKRKYKDTNELIKEAGEAFVTAKINVDKGTSPQNSALDNLNQTWKKAGITNQERTVESMQASVGNKRLKYLNDQMINEIGNINALEGDKQNNDRKRENLKKTRDRVQGTTIEIGNAPRSTGKPIVRSGGNEGK